jgi:hypothetical protein
MGWKEGAKGQRALFEICRGLSDAEPIIKAANAV